MIKYLATIVFCALCLAVLLSGCGGGAEDDEPTATTQPINCTAPHSCQ